MVNGIGNFDTARALANFGDWTDRVAKGELPFAKPTRPAGIERNIVLTEWDWATPTAYLHDEISTDRRNPTLNRARPDLWLAGSELGLYSLARSGRQQVRASSRPNGAIPKRRPPRPRRNSRHRPIGAREAVWDSHTDIHNPWMDEKGRVWLTARIRPATPEPAFCKAGSNHPSAKAFPLNRSGRQLEVYDPQDQEGDADRSVLLDASSAVRQERHDLVLERQHQRRSRRLVRREEVGCDP